MQCELAHLEVYTRDDVDGLFKYTQTIADKFKLDNEGQDIASGELRAPALSSPQDKLVVATGHTSTAPLMQVTRSVSSRRWGSASRAPSCPRRWASP